MLIFEFHENNKGTSNLKKKNSIGKELLQIQQWMTFDTNGSNSSLRTPHKAGQMSVFVFHRYKQAIHFKMDD